MPERAQLLLEPTLHFVSHGFGFEPKVHAKTGGGKIFQDVAVFRSGSFADSRGIRNTWEDLHIRQMVDNLSHLTKKNIIESVPARDGHPEFLVNGMRGKGEVVGWHLDLKAEVKKSPVNGTEYTYLIADYEITAPYALEKIERKLWRNRSSEIGGYVTNDESEFWPVYLGFAFVDFGAVEGLNFSMSQGNRSYVIFGENPLREKNVSGDNTQQTAGQPLLFGVIPSQQAPATPPVVPATLPAAPQPFMFSVGGQNVTDPVAVQSHINRLESFVRETRESARKDFVAGLVKSNKMAAPQQAGQEQFALSLTDDQFAAWKTQWDSAGPLSLLGQHASGVTNPNNSSELPKADDKIEIAKSVVAMHRLNNMSDATIRSTDSFKTLLAAGIEK